MSLTSLPRRSYALSVRTCRLRWRIASCTELLSTRSKLPAPIVCTKRIASTMRKRRKNSIDFSGTFSCVGELSTGAV